MDPEGVCKHFEKGFIKKEMIYLFFFFFSLLKFDHYYCSRGVPLLHVAVAPDGPLDLRGSCCFHRMTDDHKNVSKD